DEIGRRYAIRAIGRDHGDVRVGQLGLGFLPHGIPALVKHETPCLEREKIACRAVIRDVAFEEYDRVSPPGERSAQPSPQGRVPIAPRRAHGEAKDDELHTTPAASTRSGSLALAAVGSRPRSRSPLRATSRSSGSGRYCGEARSSATQETSARPPQSSGGLTSRSRVALRRRSHAKS